MHPKQVPRILAPNRHGEEVTIGLNIQAITFATTSLGALTLSATLAAAQPTRPPLVDLLDPPEPPVVTHEISLSAILLPEAMGDNGSAELVVPLTFDLDGDHSWEMVFVSRAELRSDMLVSGGSPVVRWRECSPALVLRSVDVRCPTAGRLRPD